MARPTDRRVALLSIHPRFASAILRGAKTIELRRTPLPPEVSHIVLYATSPIRRVVGWFEVSHIERGRPSTLWRRYRHQTGVTASEFRDYFGGAKQGTAIAVGHVVPLSEPLELAAVAAGAPPQSLCYLDDRVLNLLADTAADQVTAAG